SFLPWMNLDLHRLSTDPDSVIPPPVGVFLPKALSIGAKTHDGRASCGLWVALPDHPALLAGEHVDGIRNCLVLGLGKIQSEQSVQLRGARAERRAFRRLGKKKKPAIIPLG